MGAWTRAGACAIALSAASVSSACDGTIFDPGVGPGNPTVPPPGGGVEGPAPATRVPRLTHGQYENTVRDLFGLASDTRYAASFTPDPITGGFAFDNDGRSLRVDSVRWLDYQRAAAQIAADVTGDAAALARIAPVPSDARAFVTSFGQRAYRRPLTSQEADELVERHTAGASLYSGLDPAVAGVRLVIESVLQSPYFLYRVEQSSAPSGAVVPLTDWEIATRLSYALWNTMPDDALFAAAAAGELRTPDQVRAHAERMLGDPRAEAVVAHFHAQFLDTYKLERISPSTAFFPGIDAARLRTAAREERDRFVRSIFSTGGSYADLLTSPETFVNRDLADLYGLPGTYGDSFEPVTLDVAQRRGIFTQIGFLAANATSAVPDPIHRGVFLAERISCMTIGAPPDIMGATIPAPAPGRTNRQAIEALTEEPPECAVCHASIINPLGYPFEMFDATGRFQTTDNDLPVDTETMPMIDGVRQRVSSALELADALAQSRRVHECYAQHWVEFALGRHEAGARDVAWVRRLGALSNDGASMRELLVALVTSPSFLSRSTDEVTP